MELSAAAQSWILLILVWIGFGTVVGFAANLFLPDGRPSGFFSNLVVGITGSCVGPVAFAVLLKPQHFHPMSVIGFALAVFASIVLLLIYRCVLLFFPNPSAPPKPPPTSEQTPN